jgi:hypothetical protein
MPLRERKVRTRSPKATKKGLREASSAVWLAASTSGTGAAPWGAALSVTGISTLTELSIFCLKTVRTLQNVRTLQRENTHGNKHR